MSDRDKGKIKLNLFLISIVIFQIIVVSLILSSNLIIERDLNNETINQDEDSSQKTIKGDTILPNLTRTYEPLVLSNETASEIWSKLHGHHINNIRIAYYSMSNEWTLVSFQLDEKAYFRTYKYELSFQYKVSFVGASAIDITNWGHFDVEHRYAGRHINDSYYTPYEEPTKYECEMSYWYTREQEQYHSPDSPPLNPIQDPDELPGGPKEQLKHRIDWDDEVCFYAQKGKKANPYNWWNHTGFLYRYEMKITDPVDGGYSWMYIYYNNESMESPPSINYYIPPNDQDYVSWDKNSLRLTAETYELTIDDLNNDIDSKVRIKLPGLIDHDLYVDCNRQYLSSNINFCFDPGMITPIEESTDVEMWREGEWQDPGLNDYNEISTTIGYNIQMDFGFDDSGEDWSGHRRNSDVTAEGEYIGDHSCLDATFVIFLEPGLPQDHGDHDGDVSEIVPYVRGIIDSSGADNEAAIDGPCRVILDKFTYKNIKADFGGVLDYEEIWITSSQRVKYYANMIETDPYSLNFNISELDIFDIDINPHYMFFQTQSFSDFVRLESSNSFILLGAAPNGEAGIKVDFPQANSGTKTWPLYLYPDENGNNDGVLSGGNPLENHYDDSHLLPGSGAGYGSNPAADNPLSDWKYLHTSSGGAWSYIPYQELWPIFTIGANRDLATFWKDTSVSSEWGIYGNDGDLNGITEEFCERTVFANLTHWECKREYARMKYPLKNSLEFLWDVPTLPPVFEDSEVIINGDPISTYPWLKQGDQVDILLDINSNLPTDVFSSSDVTNLVDSGLFTITQINPVLFIYNLSFIVDTSNSDRFPPMEGYFINVSINVPPYGHYIEEFYLDKTDPVAPTSVSAVQNGAAAEINWSGESDNGQINYYEIFRNGTLIETLDPPANQWTDYTTVYSYYYTYFIRVYDMAGNYEDSSPETVPIYSPGIDPGVLDTLPPYFNDTIIINWTCDPGTGLEGYRVHWAENINGPYTATVGGWLMPDVFTYNFDPDNEDATPQNGTYNFKLESYDFETGIYIFSNPVSSLYDTEKPIPGVIVDIPDEYYAVVPEIPIQWCCEFDAFSGIDYFILQKSLVGPSGPWTNIATIPNDQHSYDDTDVSGYNPYWYRIITFDKAGNYDITPVEYVYFYMTPLGYLKIDSVDISEFYIERGANFNVTVRVSNIGFYTAYLNTLTLDFYHFGYGDVSSQYSNIQWSGVQNIDSGNYMDFVFNSVTVSPTAFQGEVVVDATLLGSNNDYNADISDSIWIIASGLPSDITLESDAENPDMDGVFCLSWNKSYNADNYSVFIHNRYISNINDTIKELNSGITKCYLPILNLTDGVYYFVIVAFNEYGNTSSNCICVTVEFQDVQRQGFQPNNTFNSVLILQTFMILGLLGIIALKKVITKRSLIR